MWGVHLQRKEVQCEKRNSGGRGLLWNQDISLLHQVVRVLYLTCVLAALTLPPSSTLCSAEITFKTDPKNTDYAAEHGASRNFEPWREEQAVEEEDRLAKLEEEENNPMKVLENRTTDSKREMDILDALQDIRARNARNERMGHSVDLLARIEIEELENEEEKERKRLEDEDEKMVREVFSKVTVPASSTLDSTGTPTVVTVTVKRKADDIEPSLQSLLGNSARSTADLKSTAVERAKKARTHAKLGIKLAKKMKKDTSPVSS